MTMTDGEATELVQQFFAARPDVMRAFISFAREKSREIQSDVRHDDHLALRRKHARDLYFIFLKFVAHVALDLHDSRNAPQSTVAAAEALFDAQHKIPQDLPLPLLWPATQTYPRNPPGISETVPFSSVPHCNNGTSNGNPSQGQDSLVDALVHRLAITARLSLTFPPEYFPPEPRAAAGTAPPVVAGWVYGSFYRIIYPEGTAVNEASDKLQQTGLKLPRAVFNLGRLVTTSERENQSDGTTWSPSDFTVMVDMESTARTVWLLCDSHVSNDLRGYHFRQGVDEDLEMIRKLFDPSAMDLAVLFPRIDDWTKEGNTWAAVHDRISKTAMKLGLRLRCL